jgi:hypothetical protein
MSWCTRPWASSRVAGGQLDDDVRARVTALAEAKADIDWHDPGTARAFPEEGGASC